MDYKGNDFGSENAQDLTELTIRLTSSLQFARIESLPELPPSNIQPSFPILQNVMLEGNNPDLYNAGYKTEPNISLQVSETKNMTFVSNDTIRWERTQATGTVVRLHITGQASFYRLGLPTVLAVQMQSANALNLVYSTTLLNRVRFDGGNPQEVGVYNIDYIYTIVLDPNLYNLYFTVIVNNDFGPNLFFTKTLTGGWQENYRNFIQVKQLQ